MYECRSSTMTKSYAVIGSGFRAFCNCLHLSENKDAKVYMIAPAKNFGGVMNSRKVGEFYVDNGVHMFDSIPSALGEIISDIMQNKILDIDFVSESSFGGKITEGFSLPDLSALPDEQINIIRSELISVKDTKINASEIVSVHDYFLTLYGVTAGKIFIDIFKRLYNVDPKLIHKDAISTTSLARLKFMDDASMLELKSMSSRLDNTLAARRKAQGKLDNFVSIYPKSPLGMRGWCENAKPWLEKQRNVEFLLQNNLEDIEVKGDKLLLKISSGELLVDHIIWANDDYSKLAEIFDLTSSPDNYFHHVPMVFVTLVTAKKFIKNFTYIQNFNHDGICNRFAASGIYSDQVTTKGLSFITAECPTSIGGDTWESHETLHNQVWEEAKSLGVVAQNAKLEGFDTIRVPKTVKMKMIKFDEKYATFRKELREKSKGVIVSEKVPFFRREIFLQSKDMFGLINDRA